MNVLKFKLNPTERHRIFSCREIAYEYAAYGHAIFQRYVDRAFVDVGVVERRLAV